MNITHFRNTQDIVLDESNPVAVPLSEPGQQRAVGRLLGYLGDAGLVEDVADPAECAVVHDVAGQELGLIVAVADEGDSVFRRLASQLRERFPNQRRFYLDRLSLADSQPQQTSVYLRYKRYVEELLLQAINET